MSRLPPGMLAWIAGGVLLSAAAAYLAARIGARGHHHPAPHGHTKNGKGADLHAWMHEQLDISPEQWARLEPFEKSFENDSAQLLQKIKTGGEQLASAIGEGSRGAPAIQDALDRINQAQAELQKITLDHFFVMKEHLDPEQAKRLLEWTHESITRQHHD